MNRTHSLLVMTVLLAVTGVSADDTGERHGLKPVPGSFFVSLEEGADRARLRKALRSLKSEIHHEYRLVPERLNVRGVPPGAEGVLARLPGVVTVTPDYEARAALTESVPLIGALADDPAMADTLGGATINVCVIDTGINPTHVFFSDSPNRLLAWKDFVNGLPAPYDDHGHGTHVAGIVGGTRHTLVSGGGDEIQGVAYRANLYLAKVLNDQGGGSFSDVEAAIDWCAGAAADSPAARAHVINMSLGGGSFSEVCDTTDDTGTAAVVNAAAALGVLVVSAAGNEMDENGVLTPACASGSMAIGAVYDANVHARRFSNCLDRRTAPDQIACFSNRWDFLDVVAPGCVIHSADYATDDFFIGGCGTSMAAPHVAGLAALVMAVNPSMTAAEVRFRISSTAKDLGACGFDRIYGNGRIRAHDAVNGCFPAEPAEVSCGDGVDNDCNRLIDCCDASCSAAPECSCVPKGGACSSDAQCCSGRCAGRAGAGACR